MLEVKLNFEKSWMTVVYTKSFFTWDDFDDLVFLTTDLGKIIDFRLICFKNKLKVRKQLKVLKAESKQSWRSK